MVVMGVPKKWIIFLWENHRCFFFLMGKPWFFMGKSYFYMDLGAT